MQFGYIEGEWSMLNILPALLWIIAAVIAVNICSISAIRGNLFSKKNATCIPYLGRSSHCILRLW